MGNVIEKVVSDCVIDKKREKTATDGKPESDLPSDAVSVAREVDEALGKLKYAYGKLKNRLRKDSSLMEKIEDLVENEAMHVIKPY